MNIFIVYPSGKLGDLIWHLPFLKIISKHYNKRIIFITRSSTDAKHLLKNENHIKEVIYVDFKKGFFNYWLDVFYLVKKFNIKKAKDVWILDKVSRPAIAGFLSRANNVFAYGTWPQNIFINNKNRLIKNDLKTHYIARGKKFLKLMNFKKQYEEPHIKMIEEDFLIIKQKLNLSAKPIIAYGVDSREKHRMWPINKFIELIKKISQKHKLQHCIIASPSNQNIVIEILKNIKNIEAHDCSQLTITEMAPLLKKAIIFIGNDSGPYNLSAAVGTMSIGINGALKPLTHSKYFFPITPKEKVTYSLNDRPVDKYGKEIKERWIQERITVEQVYGVFSDIIN